MGSQRIQSIISLSLCVTVQLLAEISSFIGFLARAHGAEKHKLVETLTCHKAIILYCVSHLWTGLDFFQKKINKSLPEEL